jgi:hypothetical protein
VKLAPDLQHDARSNLSILSLLPARDGMPDPARSRATIAELVRRMGDP